MNTLKKKIESYNGMVEKIKASFEEAGKQELEYTEKLQEAIETGDTKEAIKYQRSLNEAVSDKMASEAVYQKIIKKTALSFVELQARWGARFAEMQKKSDVHTEKILKIAESLKNVVAEFEKENLPLHAEAQQWKSLAYHTENKDHERLYMLYSPAVPVNKAVVKAKEFLEGIKSV